MTRLLALLFAALVLAGCANIPAQTQPKVVLDDAVADPAPISGPARDIDQFSLVQAFLDNAGNVAAAKTYLTEEARETWPGDGNPIIVKDDVAYRPEIPAAGVPEDKDPNVEVITLTTREVGSLKSDGSYYPTIDGKPRQDRLVLRRQPDNQWRIAELPSTRLIAQQRFSGSFRRVNLQFFDPAQKVLVPDPRWVADEPRDTLESRVLELLFAGPSEALQGAVVSSLEGVTTHTNIVRDSDGAIRVNLTNVDGKSLEERNRMVAQIVNSLSGVTLNQLRLLDNDSALIPDRQDWRTGDVPTYDVLATPKSDLTGLAVEGRKIISLRDGRPIAGPAGSGAYDLASAAQSLDGGHLAVVERVNGGVRLRIGPINQELFAVTLDRATSLTRPTWTPGSAEGEPGNEVWTVLNETTVLRAVRTAQGGWSVLPVNASDLTRGGGRITELRLSRDGVRVAAVVNGQVQVASIVRTDDSVTIRSPRTLQFGTIRQVVSLDWSERTVLVVATDLPGLAVVSMPVDGYETTPYLTTNLRLPINAVTAAPSRPVVITDQADIWSTDEPGKIFLSAPQGSAASVPFYPG